MYEFPSSGQRPRSLHEVLTLAENTLDSALERLDDRNKDEVLDSLWASRLLVATARQRLERTVVLAADEKGQSRRR